MKIRYCCLNLIKFVQILCVCVCKYVSLCAIPCPFSVFLECLKKSPDAILNFNTNGGKKESTIINFITGFTSLLFGLKRHIFPLNLIVVWFLYIVICLLNLSINKKGGKHISKTQQNLTARSEEIQCFVFFHRIFWKFCA